MQKSGKTGHGRRDVLALAASAGAVLVSGPALAATDAPAASAPRHRHGVFGKASAGPGRPVIAMLVHPKMVMQDFVGPLTVFNLMMSEIHLVWKNLSSVSTEVGLPVTPSTTFADCPANLDVLFVPGGLDGTIDCMNDPEVVAFLADRGKTARFVTSDCTGSLLLGAAGLLRGFRATSNWATVDLLGTMGAIPVHERVVHDRTRLTGGGVTAGIDFGLTLCALLKSEEDAKRIQLIIEYAPAPPFNAGRPETAPPALVEGYLKGRGPTIERARQASKAAAKSFN